MGAGASSATSQRRPGPFMDISVRTAEERGHKAGALPSDGLSLHLAWPAAVPRLRANAAAREMQ